MCHGKGNIYSQQTTQRFWYIKTKLHLRVNPLTTNALHHIETSQLICIANQLTGFYIMTNIGR